MESRRQEPIELNAGDTSARNAATVIRLLAEYTSKLDAVITAKRQRAERRRRMQVLPAAIGILGVAVLLLAFNLISPTQNSATISPVLALFAAAAAAVIGYYYNDRSVKDVAPAYDPHLAITEEELRTVLRTAIQLEEHAARNLDTGTRVELDVRIKEAYAALSAM
jgi:hypothetical protein